MTDTEIQDLWRCYNPPPGQWKPILDFAHALLQQQPLDQAQLDGYDFAANPPELMRED